MNINVYKPILLRNPMNIQVLREDSQENQKLVQSWKKLVLSIYGWGGLSKRLAKLLQADKDILEANNG